MVKVKNQRRGTVNSSLGLHLWGPFYRKFKTYPLLKHKMHKSVYPLVVNFLHIYMRLLSVP